MYRLRMGRVCVTFGVVSAVLCAIVGLWAQATSYTWQTLAGRPAHGSNNGATATAAFYQPEGIAVDSSGVVYVADTYNHVIRRISTSGIVSTIAGAAGVSGNVSGLGGTARLYWPIGIVSDSAGTIYFIDYYGFKKIAPDGTVSTITNYVTAYPSSSGYGLIIDGAGYAYLTGSNQIFKITLSSGAASTFAGSYSSGYVDATGTNARFNRPTGLTRDAAGNLYTIDTLNYVIRKITPAGVVTTFGSQLPKGSVSTDGAYGIGINASTNTLYVADTVTHQIIAVASDGTQSVLAGGYEVAGPIDGTGTAARFNYPYALAVTPGGDILVADTYDNIIRKVTSAGVVTTYAGIGGGAGYANGSRTAARFNYPRSVALGASGAVFVADYSNCVIRKVTASGTVTTFAGTISSGGTPSCGSTDATGTAAKLNYPSGIASDSSGTLYVADTANSTIRKITTAGVVTTFAGTAGTPGSTDGTSTAASFYVPQGVTVDTSGNVYVADTGNATIRKITSGGVVSTLAGTAGSTGTTDGTGSAARFSAPTGIAVDTSGNLYVSDQSNNSIRKVTPAGVVTTFAGSTSGASGTTDGTGTAARFNHPSGLTVDSDGNVYVADSTAPLIRMITPAGVVTTIGGTAGLADFAEGTDTASRFAQPYGITVDGSKNLFVADMNNQAIRVGLSSAAAAPAFTTQPTNQTIAIGGTTAQFTVAASGNLPPSIQWQVSTDFGQNWTDLAETSPYSGTTTTTLTITNPAKTLDANKYRAVATNLSGSAQSQAALLTIVQMKATPTSLKFGATKNGASGDLLAVTPAQAVTVTFSGTTSTWTASVNQSWVQITSGSGTGNGRFTVSIVNPSNVLGGSTSVSATITITPGSGSLSTITIPVALTITQTASATAAPFGQVDTPAQSATGVVGAIGVTGWVLDDVGIQSVKLYRPCLTAEPQVNCDTSILAGQSVVYIGDAVLVNGARPDVEAAFPTYPATNLAGWGLQVLTNMLPRTTGTYAAYGGQGPMTFYVIAKDVDGHSTLLGRAYTGDSTPTTITMDNDNIVKPFGTMDTPGQGATISGTYANFGWALTPDSNTTADATDILVPTDGSTMYVFIDGTAVATVAYNQCRGNVGNPVPAGVYCNDDVANIFGNTTPQATLTTRTSNPTRFRNLDAARAAIGAYNIDTTALGNGLHTIAWSVTDSAGRVEGIGSRYFTVLNGSSDPAAVRALADAPARVLGQATDVTWRPLATGAVWGRAGFDLRAPWELIVPDSAGTRHVRLPQSGRLDLSLGRGITSGYLVANGTLRALPTGSRLTDGHFTWAPPLGYLGAYALVFLNGIEQVPVTVTIHPASDQPRIQGYIDAPHAGETVSGAFTVAGWAADTTAWAGTGIGAVHVWAHRRDADTAPVFLGAADVNGWRPDVGVTIGAQFERAGWVLTAPALPPGEYDLVAYFWSLKTQQFEDARVVRVSVR